MTDDELRELVKQREANAKRVTVVLDDDKRTEGTVTLYAFTKDEPLTPKLARRALQLVGNATGEVYDLDFGFGYRVYERSARKLRTFPASYGDELPELKGDER